MSLLYLLEDLGDVLSELHHSLVLSILVVIGLHLDKRVDEVLGTAEDAVDRCLFQSFKVLQAHLLVLVYQSAQLAAHL